MLVPGMPELIYSLDLSIIFTLDALWTTLNWEMKKQSPRITPLGSKFQTCRGFQEICTTGLGESNKSFTEV